MLPYECDIITTPSQESLYHTFIWDGAKYLLNLASSFNKFYSLEKINVEDEKTRNTNFLLAYSVRTVLNEGLRLLGIKYLEEM